MTQITLSASADHTITVTGDASISGTNTGDQTITLTGDVTGSGVGSFATTLATVNSNVGSFGDTTHVGSFTVNGKGLVTAASSTAIAFPVTSVSGKTGDVTLTSSDVGLGNLTNDAQVKLSIVTTKGDLIVATGNATVSRLGVGTNGQVLTADSTQTNGIKWATPSSPSGSVVQVVNYETGAVATGTTNIPNDDTIPQSSEGTQYMSLSITPTNTNNKLKIEVVVYVSNSTGGRMIAALLQDSGTDALACGSTCIDNTVHLYPIVFTYYKTAGTTSSTTFKVNCGAQGGTMTFNGEAGSRVFGGVCASSITITEIAA